MDTRRISRSRSGRIVAGVASGIATYLRIDPMIVRLGFIILTPINGFGLLLYLILWLIVPNEDSQSEGRATIAESLHEMRALLETTVSRIRATFQR
jgi:phage shock protein C